MLKDARSADNRYLFAKSCIDLDEGSEAEQALLSYVNECGVPEVPCGAAGILHSD